MDSVVITGGVKNVPYLRASDNLDFVDNSRRVNWYVRDAQSGEQLRQFRAVLTKEVNGGYSIEVPQLPGVFSQGETRLEAIANIKEAMLAILDSYQKDGSDVPWTDEVPELDESQNPVWIALNVQAS